MEVEGALRALFQEGANESYSCLLPHLSMLTEHFGNATVTEDQLSRITTGLSKIYSAASSNPPGFEDRKDFDKATLKLLDSMTDGIETQDHLRNIVGCLLMVINCHALTDPYHASSTSPSLYALAVRAVCNAWNYAVGNLWARVTTDMVKVLLQCYTQPYDRVACLEALGVMAQLMGHGGADEVHSLELMKVVLDVIASGDPDAIPERLLQEVAYYFRDCYDTARGPHHPVLTQNYLDGTLGPALISLLHKRPSTSLFFALDMFVMHTPISHTLLVQGGAIQAVTLAALKMLAKDSHGDSNQKRVAMDAYYILKSLIDIRTKEAAMMLYGCGGIEMLLNVAIKVYDPRDSSKWLTGIFKSMVEQGGESMAVQCIKKGATPILRFIWGSLEEEPGIDELETLLQKVLQTSSGMYTLLGELRLPLADRQAATWVACFLGSHAPMPLLADVMVKQGCLDLLCNALSPPTCSCQATVGSEQCEQATADHAMARERVDGDADAAPSGKRQRTESSSKGTCTCPGHPHLREETWRAAARSLQRLWASVTATGDACAGVALKVILPEEYINNERFSDMKFVVEGRPFYASRMVVREASELLRGITDENWDRREVVVDDVSYAVWELAMHFAHTGTADIPAELLQPVLVAADQYLLDGLKVHCQERLVAVLKPTDIPEMMRLCNQRCLPVLQQHCVKLALEEWAGRRSINPTTVQHPLSDDLVDTQWRAQVVDVIRSHVRQHLGGL